MKTLCSSGFKISNSDQKALDEYLLTSPKEWADSALKGMINKAIKTILRDWLDIYKSKVPDGMPNDLSAIIQGIVSMPEFKPYNYPVPTIPSVERDEAKNLEIWQDGFSIEDYEKMALDAYYSNPEEQLCYFMENKIDLRKKAFVKQYLPEILKDKSILKIPSRSDAFIDLVTGRPGYQKRKDRPVS